MNIVITGASSGVGFEAVIELTSANHKVIALARSQDKLERLAEIAARGRTFDQEALPLFLSLDQNRRNSLAEITVAIKNHLDAMQDSIADIRASLNVLVDFLADK